MVSTVNIASTHVSGSCVTALTESVHMVVLKALMETVVMETGVNFQVVYHYTI
jgi:hypothetical protein